MNLNSDCQRQVLGRLDPNTFLPLYPHNCVPCHNLQTDIYLENDCLESFSCLFSKLPYIVSFPIPVSFPSQIEKEVLNGMDPVLQLVKAKKHWEECKLQIIRFCDGNVSGIERGRKKMEVPSNVLLLANHLSKDPDPYFSANYNSYYNGSNISCLHLGSEAFLIRTVPSAHGEIAFSRLFVNTEDQWDIEYQSLVNASTEVPGPIYEIYGTVNKVITRQKECITLFSINEEGNQLDIQRKITIKKDIPLISVSTFGNNVGLLSMDRKLEVFDSTVGHPLLEEKLFDDNQMKSDSWGSVHFLNENTLSVLDRSSYSLVDLRMNADVVRQWPIKDVSEHCEELYGGKPGRNELQYLSTSHQVLSLDLRMGFSQRWTHGISHSPALISVLSSSLIHDSVFIGSQRNDTVVLLQNEWIKDKVCSKVPPYAIPSLRDTLHLSRYNGYCLSNTILSRFNMCLTGLCSMENKGNITLFRSTSLGDVFKQTLVTGSKEIDLHLTERELNRLEEWGQHCEDLLVDLDSPCFATDVLDVSNILQCIQSDGKKYEEPFSKKNIDQGEWKVSKKELMSYCDYLAPRILEEWGIDEEEEWCNIPEKVIDNMSSDEEEDVTERVAKWMEKYAEEMVENPTVVEDNIETKAITEVSLSDSTVTTESKAIPEVSLSNITVDIVPKNMPELNLSSSTAEVTFGQLSKIEDSIVKLSSVEPSSQKQKVSTSTPRRKFISGF